MTTSLLLILLISTVFLSRADAVGTWKNGKNAKHMGTKKKQSNMKSTKTIAPSMPQFHTANPTKRKKKHVSRAPTVSREDRPTMKPIKIFNDLTKTPTIFSTNKPTNEEIDRPSQTPTSIPTAHQPHITQKSSTKPNTPKPAVVIVNDITTAPTSAFPTITTTSNPTAGGIDLPTLQPRPPVDVVSAPPSVASTSGTYVSSTASPTISGSSSSPTTAPSTKYVPIGTPSVEEASSSPYTQDVSRKPTLANRIDATTAPSSTVTGTPTAGGIDLPTLRPRPPVDVVSAPPSVASTSRTYVTSTASPTISGSSSSPTTAPSTKYVPTGTPSVEEASSSPYTQDVSRKPTLANRIDATTAPSSTVTGTPTARGIDLPTLQPRPPVDVVSAPPSVASTSRTYVTSTASPTISGSSSSPTTAPSTKYVPTGTPSVEEASYTQDVSRKPTLANRIDATTAPSSTVTGTPTAGGIDLPTLQPRPPVDVVSAPPSVASTSGTYVSSTASPTISGSSSSPTTAPSTKYVPIGTPSVEEASSSPYTQDVSRKPTLANRIDATTAPSSTVTGTPTAGGIDLPTLRPRPPVDVVSAPPSVASTSRTYVTSTASPTISGSSSSPTTAPSTKYVPTGTPSVEEASSSPYTQDVSRKPTLANRIDATTAPSSTVTGTPTARGIDLPTLQPRPPVDVVSAPPSVASTSGTYVTSTASPTISGSSSSPTTAPSTKYVPTGTPSVEEASYTQDVSRKPTLANRIDATTAPSSTVTGTPTAGRIDLPTLRPRPPVDVVSAPPSVASTSGTYVTSTASPTISGSSSSPTTAPSTKYVPIGTPSVEEASSSPYTQDVSRKPTLANRIDATTAPSSTVTGTPTARGIDLPTLRPRPPVDVVSAPPSVASTSRTYVTSTASPTISGSSSSPTTAPSTKYVPTGTPSVEEASSSPYTQDVSRKPTLANRIDATTAPSSTVTGTPTAGRIDLPTLQPRPPVDVVSAPPSVASTSGTYVTSTASPTISGSSSSPTTAPSTKYVPIGTPSVEEASSSPYTQDVSRKPTLANRIDATTAPSSTVTGTPTAGGIDLPTLRPRPPVDVVSAPPSVASTSGTYVTSTASPTISGSSSSPTTAPSTKYVPTGTPSVEEASSSPYTQDVSRKPTLANRIDATTAPSSTVTGLSKMSPSPTSAGIHPPTFGPTPSAIVTLPPSLYSTESLFPSESPSISPSAIITDCISSPDGNYGTSSSNSSLIFVDYRYELTANVSILNETRSSIATLIDQVEKSLSTFLLPTLFKNCSRSVYKSSLRIRRTESFDVVGISSDPQDVLAQDECQLTDHVNGGQCVVVNGRLTLFAAPLPSNITSLVTNISTSIIQFMDDRTIASSNRAIIHLQYIYDPGHNIPHDSSILNDNHVFVTSWPVIVGTVIGMCVVLLVALAAKRYSGRVRQSRMNYDDSDHSVSSASNTGIPLYAIWTDKAMDGLNGARSFRDFITSQPVIRRPLQMRETNEYNGVTSARSFGTQSILSTKEGEKSIEVIMQSSASEGDSFQMLSSSSSLPSSSGSDAEFFVTVQPTGRNEPSKPQVNNHRNTDFVSTNLTSFFTSYVMNCTPRAFDAEEKITSPDSSSVSTLSSWFYR